MFSESALRLLATQAVEEKVFPGCAISFGTSEEVLFEEGFGQLGENLPIIPSPTTVYDIASLTKVMCTASLLMQAYEQQEFDFSDLVVSFLPDLNQSFLMHHLMTHSSGLPAWKPFFEMLGPRVSKDQMLQAINQEKLEQMPGEKAVYSDIGFILLGYVLEEIFAEDLATLFKNKVSEPLNLRRTTYLPLKAGISLNEIAPTEKCEFRNRLVHGEVHDENAFVLGGVAGHAGLFSSAHDVGVFARWVLKSMESNTALTTSSVMRMFAKPQHLPAESTWALCWDTPCVENSSAGSLWSRQAIGHLGYSGCSLWIDIPKKRYAVLLSNRVHPTRKNEKIKAFRPVFHDLLSQ